MTPAPAGLSSHRQPHLRMDFRTPPQAAGLSKEFKLPGFLPDQDPKGREANSQSFQ
jgi:hypothetical protein